MKKLTKVEDQKVYLKVKKKRVFEVRTLTVDEVSKMKVKPKAWERFDFIIPGVNVREIEHFNEIHKRNGLKNQCQTLRMILYKYDDNAGKKTKSEGDQDAL